MRKAIVESKKQIRLQKLLAQAGICSRREGERFILDGRVAVNDMVVTELGTRVNPETDRVVVDGKPVGGAEEPVRAAVWRSDRPDGTMTVGGCPVGSVGYAAPHRSGDSCVR